MIIFAFLLLEKVCVYWFHTFMKRIFYRYILQAQTQYSQAQMRKTPNLLIRDPHRKLTREAVQPPPSVSSTKIQTKQNSNENHITVTNPKQQKKSSLRSIPAINQKQLVLAETLNQYEQMQIQNEVKKAVGKKLRASESKIESDMVGMLEGQCQRLGQQLERQRMCNEKLRSQIEKMRQNIQSLNVKLQKMHQDHNHLSKHQESGKVQNKHLLTQIAQFKHNLRNKQVEIQSILDEKEEKIIQKNIQIQKLNSRLQRYQQQITALRELKQSAENQVEQVTKQAEYLRETLEKKKMEWNEIHRELDSKAKANLNQKSQKISKHQAEILKLQDKLKEEQTIRKKLTQRNKELEKQAVQKGQVKKQLEQIITNYKKRINDLSILKSSNNTILNQKIAELHEQNQKLRAQIERIKGNIKSIQISQTQKPVLFGAHDFQ